MKTTYALVVACTLLIVPLVAKGDWVRTTGPYGGASLCFLMDGGSYYMGTPAGLYVSSNQGSTWAPIGLDGFAVSAIVRGDSGLFAAVGNQLYHSKDDGATWVSVQTLEQNVFCLASFRGALFAGLDINMDGTSGGSVFKSTGNGTTWTRVFTVSGSRHEIGSLVVAHNALIAATWGAGMFRSIDSGAHWLPANSGILPQNRDIWTATFVSQYVFAATNNAGVYLSTDDGATWQPMQTIGIPSSADIYSFAFVASSGVAVASTADDATYYAVGTGQWRLVGSGFPQGNFVYMLAANDVKIFAGLDQGLHASTNGGVWTPVRHGQNADTVYAMALHNDMLFAAGLFGIQWSTDQGATWTDPGPADVTNNKTIRVLKEFNGRLYAGGEGFFIYDDFVQGWTQLADSLDGYMVDCAALGDSLYSACELSLIKCTGDSGFTWTPKSAGIPQSNVVVNSILAQGTSLFAAVQYVGGGTPPANQAGVWRSVDSAATWTFAGSGLPRDVRVNNIIGRLNYDFYLGTANHGLYHSFSGIAWDHDTTIDTVSNVRVYGIPGAILTAVNDSGLLVSQFYGQPWNAQAGKGLFAPSIYSLIGDDSMSYVGMSSTGVWRRPTGEFAPVGVSEHVPQSITLLQQYPNPVTTSDAFSTIAFQLPNDEHVTITVFDMLGRQVARLADHRFAAGPQRVQFSTAALSPGSYISVLRFGNVVETGRLVVVK